MGETNENPLEGTSDEMLPERGLPVDEEALMAEADAMVGATAEDTEARDLTPEEVEALAEGAPEDGEGEGRGMGAVEPILRDEEVVGLPTEEPSLPPPESTQGMPVFSEASLSAPGPDEGLPGGEAMGPSEGLEASQDMVALLITEPVLRTMWERADRAQQLINERIDSVPLARQLLSLVERARNEILAGRGHYEEAERALSEVEYRVAFAERVQRWSYTYGLGILAYELVWLIVLALVGINLGNIVSGLLSSSLITPLSQASGSTSLASDITIGATSILWGGLGGVVGALYALWRHVARLQDFSKQYTMWYITNPIMGITLGVFIFLVIRAGMFSLTAGASSQGITSAFAIYVMAWIAGFQQNVALDIVRRILRVFRLEEEKKEGNAG